MNFLHFFVYTKLNISHYLMFGCIIIVVEFAFPVKKSFSKNQRYEISWYESYHMIELFKNLIEKKRIIYGQSMIGNHLIIKTICHPMLYDIIQVYTEWQIVCHILGSNGYTMIQWLYYDPMVMFYVIPTFLKLVSVNLNFKLLK